MKSWQRFIGVNTDDSPAPDPSLRFYCVVISKSFESQLWISADNKTRMAWSQTTWWDAACNDEGYFDNTVEAFVC